MPDALARLGVLLFVVLAFHAPAAMAMSEAELRAKLDLGEDARIKSWPGVPDRTIVVSTALHPDPARKPGEMRDVETLDRTLLVVKTSTGEVMQRLFVANAYTSDAIAFQGIGIDTANYALAEGHRAFGLRVATEHTGCAGFEGETLELFDLRGASIQQVLILQTKSDAAMCECGEYHRIERTVATAPTQTSGYADLLVRERKSEAGDGKQLRGECVQPEKKTQRQRLLRYDGRAYTVPADME